MDTLIDPNIMDNRQFWEGYDWPQGGDEWSKPWGGTSGLWYGFLLPRLHHLVPCGNVVEIAPGFGRCTQFLRPLCRHLTAIDIAPRCVEACRARFKDDTGFSCILGDGLTLSGVPDGSVELVFSWDSLVHVEHGPLRSYLRECARVLAPGGAAFLHHSNLGEYAGALHGINPATDLGNRTVSVSAENVRADCHEFGLRCLTQELLQWNKPRYLNDCLSYIVRAAGGAGGETQVIRRKDFSEEIATVRRNELAYAPR